MTGIAGLLDTRLDRRRRRLAAALAAALGAATLGQVVGAPAARAAVEVPTGLLSVQVTTPCCTDQYLRHQHGVARTDVVDFRSARLTKDDATFRVRSGLADPACVSFETYNYPGNFLRHANYRVQNGSSDGTALFNADATFCPQAGAGGDGITFESYNLRGHFLRHIDAGVYLARSGGPQPWDAPASFAENTTWRLANPWSKAATPVIPPDFPDPDVTRFGDTYYAYATNNGLTVPVATAASPTGPWSAPQEAMPELGAWAKPGRTWAPDVSVRSDGRYLLYYTAWTTSPGWQCIGAALADSPTGPFVPVGSTPLVCNGAEGGNIDASSFVDTDGRRYLLYKNEGNTIGQPTTIWLQPVQADGISFDGPRTALLTSGRTDERGVIEAPVLIRRPSQYVLFYSAGGYRGDGYATSYAVSPTLRGPYTKASRPLLTTESLDGAVRGPGGQDVVAGPDGDVLMFHGWVNNHTTRATYAAELGWANDRPVIRGSRVRYEAERGVLNRCAARSTATASQGQAVAYLDHADSWVDVPVYAAASGEHTAYVGYAAGYGAAEHTLSVNGGPPTVVSYPAGAWESWGQVAARVSLRAGWNTLRLQHRSRWAELDYIEVA